LVDVDEFNKKKNGNFTFSISAWVFLALLWKFFLASEKLADKVFW